MTQVGWAISCTKRTYLGKKYLALAARKGKKRAVIAMGRKALVIIYHILENKVPLEWALNKKSFETFGEYLLGRPKLSKSLAF